MSKTGDVVWANGRAWMKSFGSGSLTEKKKWHHHPNYEYIEWLKLKDLKKCDDFQWLVKNGVKQ